MAFQMSRIDKRQRTYTVADNLGGTYTTVDVALLAVGTKPTGLTVWTSVPYAAGVATVVWAGPDADPTGAIVVPATCDMWIKGTNAPYVQAIKDERITVLGGGAPLAVPTGIPVVSVNTKTGSTIVLSPGDVGAQPVGRIASTVTASGALVANKHNPVDATAATRTMTLPTGQAEGTTISVEKTDSSTNAVAITGNIRGVGASTISLAWQSEALILRADSSGSWWPIAGHKTKAALDATYATVASVAALGTGSGVNGDDVGFDLVLLLGQSNMSGRGTPFDTRTDPVDGRVLQYGASGTYASVVSQAVEPLAMHDTPTGIGPGLVFARYFASSIPSNRRVLLVPAAHGGTALSTNTTPLGWRRGVSGNLYAQALAQTQAALSAAGANARIAAALWLQGETDGDGSVAGSTYQTDLDALIAGLRTDLGISDLPFIIGQMVPEYLHTGTRSAINDAHLTAPSRVTRVGVALSPFASNLGDGNHFNSAGQRIIGRRMFDAYRRIVTNTAEPTLPTVPGQTTGLTASPASTTSITMTWTATTGASAYLPEYRLSGGSTWTKAATVATTTTTLSGLTASSTYETRVTPLGQRGPGTPSAIATATLGAPPDTTAPTVPGTPVATAGAGSATATTTGSTDAVGVTSYVWWRNGTTVVTGQSGTTLTDTGVTAGTPVFYTVSARDAAGNESAASAASNSVTPTAGGGSTIVADSFNRADATLLGTPDTGPAWTYGSGTFGISSNQAYCVTAPTASATALLQASVADCTVSVTFTALGSSVARQRLVFRFTDQSNQWIVQNNGVGGAYKLYKMVTGTYTQVGSNMTPTPAAGDVVSVVLLGSSITVKINGVTAATATDSFSSTATKHGIGDASTSAGARFDNFSVTS